MTGKKKPALDRMLLGNIKAYTSTEKKKKQQQPIWATSSSWMC